MTAPNFNSIPGELTERPQWVLWKAIPDKAGKKPRKVPFRPDGQTASSADPATWSSFDEVVAAYNTGDFTGVGYVFAADDPYCGIDIDDINHPDAARWVKRFNSYTELSPSGHGYHIIIKGRIPDGRGRKREPFEVYSQGRFFTMTGNVVDVQQIVEAP